MPTVVVIDPSHVTIDGEPAGAVLDVPENHASIEGIKSLVLDALLAWDAARNRAHADALAAAAKAGEDAVAVATEALKASHSSALATLRAGAAQTAETTGATIAALNAQVVDLKAQVEALGGTELGQRLAKEAKIKAAREAVAKAQAALDAANGEGAVDG